MSAGNHSHRSTMAICILIGSACFVVSPAVAQMMQAQPHIPLPVPIQANAAAAIRFAVSVPPAPGQMQLYRLATTAAPVQFLNEKLGAAKLPTLNLEQKSYELRSATTGNKVESLRAYVNMRNGDTHFIPNLAELIRPKLAAAPLAAERARSIANSVFADPRFIPQDVTRLQILEPTPVMGGATEHAGGAATPTRTEPRTVMTVVPAARYVSGFKIYGIGSHAAVSLDNAGTMVGAMRRWRTATAGEAIQTGITADQVRGEIQRQLGPLVATEGTHATVDEIEVAYYDNNRDYMQPVYHFEATVEPGDRRISPIRVSGFVPIGQPREPIPSLIGPPNGQTPMKPVMPVPGQVQRMGTMGAPGDITLGEYANRNWPSDNGYITMSNSFLNGLTFLDSILPGLTPPVSRTQWYDAYPWEVVGPSSKYYMNAVNVAYTVPHGNWLINTTYSNNTDVWYVPNIGTGGNPGFGAAAGGALATWVIMSCEVVPSMYDRQNEAGGSDNPYTAFDAWWPVFQGLHNVLGFRTEMLYPDDALQFGFGYVASLGGDVNAAWFQEIAAYDGNDGTYNDGHLIGNPSVHYDRASTMIDARDLGQSIFSVGAQSPSSTLWNFWMGN
jgi:hypothetical protein